MSAPGFRPDLWAQSLLAAEGDNAVRRLFARQHQAYLAAMTPRERRRYRRWKPLRLWLRSRGLPVPAFAREPVSRVSYQPGGTVTIPRAAGR